ncbi:MULTISPECIES: DMT family transporter [Paracoccus]|jgi:drug/metabolite transporter (DMT)-like permease|nr:MULTISPECIES: DMT family transporter [Paracoccus]MBB4626473.1 drug/metabolite transporter (DMT)-like permease [Paracoccus denitrificans]MCU7430377.1 DMT family transporter [Paracoccus denitrificans]MDK8873020.1 DMT family transporter [Paracoccus sp. SSJ]QAR29027.1 DMT family transporter [Paracoccus denitrificans]UFS66878.1 DMT family transporter [Paracoccus denitrificans]
MVTENFRGAILMVVSMVLFAFEDMFIKLLAAELPYAQVLALIGLLGFLAFGAMLKLKGGRLFTRDLARPIVLFRGLMEAVGSIGIVVALALTELSSTSAIMQALPLAIVLGAALFLGEPVGWRRWSAIIVGFLGVLLVIRPGLAGFQPVSLMALMAVVGLAARDIATRRVPAHIRSDQLAASAFFAILIAAVLMGLVLGQEFVLPSLRQWLLFLACIIVGVGGYALLVSATRLGEASALAPYRYARLVFALILAFLVFGERPDAPTLTGAAIIVASGCYTMWREAALRRRRLREAGFVTAA